MPTPDHEKEKPDEAAGSRIHWLMARYFPQLVKLMGERYDWGREDKHFEAKYGQRQAYTERNQVEQYETGMTLYDLLAGVYHHPENYLQAVVMQHVNRLLGRLLAEHPELVPGIREAFEGKFSNLGSLNYLNPFGEISYVSHQLYQLHNRVIRMEAPYPNGKPKDFLVQTQGNKQQLHKLVNIHCKLTSEATEEEIQEDVIQKAREKILKETKGQYAEPAEPLSFVVVLWHTNADILRRQLALYDRPNYSIIP
jgi:urease accessory protein UreH